MFFSIASRYFFPQASGKYLLIACSLAFGLTTPPACAEGTGLITDSTGLIMDSPKGDWVGDERSWYRTEPQFSFTATKNHNNGVQVFVAGNDECWTLNFSAPNRALLQIGTYEHTLRYGFETEPFVAPVQPGLDISGGIVCSAGHGCDQNSGSFTVDEIQWSDTGEVLSFHAKFSQSCEKTAPPLNGEIFFNSSAELPPVNHLSSASAAYATRGQPFRYSITTSQPAGSYAIAGLPMGLTMDFDKGVISGTPLEQGYYSLTISATAGNSTVTYPFTLTVDPPGQSTGPFSAIRLMRYHPYASAPQADLSFSPTDGIFYGSTASNATSVSFLPWVFFDSNHLDSSGQSTAGFAPSQGKLLSPGNYLDNDDPSGPQVLISGGGIAVTRGTFTIRDLVAPPIYNYYQGRDLFQFRAAAVDDVYPALPETFAWVWLNAENVITSSPFAFCKMGEPLNYQIIANNRPSSYSAEKLPAGLSIDPPTGVISGTPQNVGTYPITISAIGPDSVASDSLRLFVTQPPSQAANLANISTRANVQTGERVLIGGFIITGWGSKQIIIRAIGPSLRQYGLQTVLLDPRLDLYDSSGNVIASNDDWVSPPDSGSSVMATGLAPTDPHEAAIVARLSAGAYTAVVSGAERGAGVGLVEIYDLSPESDAKLANISTRGFVQPGDNALIAGIILSSPGAPAFTDVLIRALGPRGQVLQPITNPAIQLYDANGTTIAVNDNWRELDEAGIASTGLAPTYDYDAAIFTTLPAGSYTAVVRETKNFVSGFSGVGLIEVYRISK